MHDSPNHAGFKAGLKSRNTLFPGIAMIGRSCKLGQPSSPYSHSTRHRSYIERFIIGHMCISKFGADILMSKYLFHDSYVTTLRNYDDRRSMPGDYMNTAFFFNACLFLVPREYSVQATLSPYLPIVDVE